MNIILSPKNLLWIDYMGSFVMHGECLQKRYDWDKLCFKARERGTAISMEGLGNELGTRDSQVKFCHQSIWTKYFDRNI